MNTYEKVIEACRLRLYMTEDYDFVKKMAEVFGCRPLKEDSDNLYHFLQTVYNAGRVEGIRYERSRRRGHVA